MLVVALDAIGGLLRRLAIATISLLGDLCVESACEFAEVCLLGVHGGMSVEPTAFGRIRSKVARLLIHLGGIFVSRSELVEPGEGTRSCRNCGIERKGLLIVGQRLRGVEQLLVKNQSELKIQGSEFFCVGARRNLAIRQFGSEGPLPTSHRNGAQGMRESRIVRIVGSSFFEVLVDEHVVVVLVARQYGSIVEESGALLPGTAQRRELFKDTS